MSKCVNLAAFLCDTVTVLGPRRGSINGALEVTGKSLVGLEGFGMGLRWTLNHSHVGGEKM